MLFICISNHPIGLSNPLAKLMSMKTGVLSFLYMPTAKEVFNNCIGIYFQILTGKIVFLSSKTEIFDIYVLSFLKHCFWFCKDHLRVANSFSIDLIQKSVLK